MTSGPPVQIVILIPVFNDWDCIALLLPLLDQAASRASAGVRVLLVDDGSTRKLPPSLDYRGANLRGVDVLHLSRNLGHQRAIGVGLYHIYRHMPCEKVIVMDGDGQDLPDHIPVLLEASARYPEQVIFAARTKRLETLAFRLFYHLYRAAHRVLTGISVRVGNFSVLPWEAVGRLLVVSDLWSHYAAAVVRARLEFQSVPLPRGQRLAGHSRMNFCALLLHGLSAISVFGDIVSARALVASASLAFATLAAGLAGLWLHSAAGLHMPPWTVYLWAATLFLSVQAVLLAFVLSIILLASRGSMSFLPLRDAHHFVRGLTQLMLPVPAETRAREVLRA